MEHEIHIMVVSFLLPLVIWGLLLETGPWAKLGWPGQPLTCCPYLLVDFSLSLTVLLRKVAVALQWWNGELFTSQAVDILLSFQAMSVGRSQNQRWKESPRLENTSEITEPTINPAQPTLNLSLSATFTCLLNTSRGGGSITSPGACSNAWETYWMRNFS